MIKKCSGCGVVLQNVNKDELGFTPDIKNDYCMRCFRLKNYGEVNLNENIDEEKIIAKVNKSKGVAFFFVDYLNINNYTVTLFNKIKIKKVLVITKVDVLRKDIKFVKVKKWLKDEYHILDDVLFLSNKTGFGTSKILEYAEMNDYKTIYIMGVTNAGKSSFINRLLKENNKKDKIVVSKKPNTTLDFMKFNINNKTIFDTPGFTYPNMSNKIINQEIKPITYQIKKETTLYINDLAITFLKPTSVTVYLQDSSIVKKDFKKITGQEISLKDNQDIVIIGLGFINVKIGQNVIINNFLNTEIRFSISGVNYE